MKNLFIAISYIENLIPETCVEDFENLVNDTANRFSENFNDYNELYSALIAHFNN